MRVVAALTWRLLVLLLGQGGTKARVVLQNAAMRRHRRSEVNSRDGKRKTMVEKSVSCPVCRGGGK